MVDGPEEHLEVGLAVHEVDGCLVVAPERHVEGAVAHRVGALELLADERDHLVRAPVAVPLVVAQELDDDADEVGLEEFVNRAGRLTHL